MPFCSRTLTTLLSGFYDQAYQPQTLGQHLRKVRLARAMKQSCVAKLFNVTEFTVLNWELGHSQINAQIRPQVVAFVGHDPEPEPRPVTLADRIKAYRRQRGWTQQRLADEWGFSADSIRGWEAEVTRPRRRALLKLGRILG